MILLQSNDHYCIVRNTDVNNFNDMHGKLPLFSSQTMPYKMKQKENTIVEWLP